MYSAQHYLTRSNQAIELAEMPENIRRKKAYLELAAYWRKLAAAIGGAERPGDANPSAS